MPEEALVPISMPDSFGDETTTLSRGILSDSVEIEYFLRPEDKAVVARVRFGSNSEEPPRCAHGGSIAAVLDECMGAACWANGHSALSARLNVRFRRPVPLGAELEVVARVASLRGRTINAKAGMKERESGRVKAEASGVYVEMKPPASGG